MKDKLKRMAAYHSDDYDVAGSDLHSELVLATTKSQFVVEQIMSWVMSVFIGIVIGCLGTGFNLCIDHLTRLRYDTTMKFIHPGGGWWQPWLVSVAFSTLFALVAGFLGSYFSPQAAGSGIPDIRAYLNGVHIRNLLSIRTLVAKSFSVSFSIASGLVAGKEGPYIHIGAILGGGLANMGSESVIRWTGGKFRAKLKRGLSSYFRHPIEHRDYVAVGSGAGLATAFGAPIGGVVFAIEEASSFFSPNVLWHAAVASGIAVYVMLVWEGLHKDPGNLWVAQFGNPFVFVMKGGADDTVAVYHYTPWDLLVFLLMGLVGGLLGALIVPMNEALYRFRRKYVPKTKPFRRMLEVVFYAVIATTIWFFISYASPCADNPKFDQMLDTSAEASGISSHNGHFKPSSSSKMYERLWCTEEGQHSEYGVLFFTPLPHALARVYADPAVQGSPDGNGQNHEGNSEEILYSAVALGCLFVITFVFLSITYGIGAAAGLFVPTLLAGASGGRLVGRIVRASLISQGVHPSTRKVSLATYAVVGSGALLGGVTRLLLCTVVLLVETSGAENLTIPLIIVSAVAKIVADFITIGIYYTDMERQAYPFLPEEPEGLEALKLSHELQVADVMTPKIVPMPVVIRIREMVAFLKTHPFSTIPLVSPDPKALREALAVQHQQQAVKQERLLQNLDAPSSVPPLGSGARSPAAPHTKQRTSRESDRAGDVGVPGKHAQRLAGMDQQQQQQQQRGDGSGATQLKPPPMSPSGLSFAGGAPLGEGFVREGEQDAAHLGSGSVEGRERELEWDAYAAQLRGAVGEGHEREGGGDVAGDGSGLEWQGLHAGGSAREGSCEGFAVQPTAVQGSAGGQPRGSPAQPHVSVASHRRPRSSNERPSLRGSAFGHAAGTSELLSIPSGRLGFHSSGMPPASPKAGAPQASSQRLSMDAGTVITSNSAPTLDPPHRKGSLQSNPSADSGMAAAAASAAPANCQWQWQSWNKQEAEEKVKKGVSESGHSMTADGSSDSVHIVGVISRSTLLNILQVRKGFFHSVWDAAKEEEGGKQGQKGAHSIREALASLETNTVKAPTTAEEQEKLFQSLSERELDSCINLRHHMQRAPYTVPANTSLARAYRLFRTLGLHHLFVTAGQTPVVGLMTRSDFVPGAPEAAMYHKMEATLSPAVTAAEAIDDAAGSRSGSTTGGLDSVTPSRHSMPLPRHSAASVAHHPRHPAAIIATTHCTATATCGGIAAASPVHRDTEVAVHGPTAADARSSKGDLDLSVRGGIMGTGVTPDGGGCCPDNNGGRAVGRASAALQASAASAEGGGEELPASSPVSRPSLNPRRHQQQQQQSSAVVGLGNGPLLSSAGTGMGVGCPWGEVSSTLDKDGGHSLTHTPCGTESEGILGTTSDSVAPRSSSCNSLRGLPHSNMLLAMPPLPQQQQADQGQWPLQLQQQLQQQQQLTNQGQLHAPLQQHHVLLVGPEQVEGSVMAGETMLGVGGHSNRTSSGSSEEALQHSHGHNQSPKTKQQLQRDAQLTFVQEQVELMMQSEGDSSVSALVKGAFLPNLEEELEALEEEAGGHTQGQQRAMHQEEL